MPKKQKRICLGLSRPWRSLHQFRELLVLWLRTKAATGLIDASTALRETASLVSIFHYTAGHSRAYRIRKNTVHYAFLCLCCLNSTKRFIAGLVDDALSGSDQMLCCGILELLCCMTGETKLCDFTVILYYAVLCNNTVRVNSPSLQYYFFSSIWLILSIQVRRTASQRRIS